MSYALVLQAVKQKKAISGYYSGLYREMCPHAIGIKNGKQQALFYQFGGQSSSRPIQPDGSSDNWRCVEIAKLSNVQIIEGSWHTAPDHSRPQTCVDWAEAVVAY